jgi:hypothetical protein
MIFEHTCPHCGLEHAGFTALAEKAHFAGGQTPTRHTIIFSCPRCFEIIAISIEVKATQSVLTNQRGDFLLLIKRTGRIVEIYPDRESNSAPEHVSEPVKRCYLQAADNKKRKNFDAAGAMYRKCLDLATKELDPGLAGKKLDVRINALHAAGHLTTPMKDWAHNVRLDGNEAAHESEELSPEEISQLAAFAEVFLQYAFSLPAQVTARRADRAAK